MLSQLRGPAADSQRQLTERRPFPATASAPGRLLPRRLCASETVVDA
jgi:hypothetical protein